MSDPANVPIVLAAGFAWFARGKSAIADAEREEQALESEETACEGPLAPGKNRVDRAMY
jgi:hypothetical protein